MTVPNLSDAFLWYSQKHPTVKRKAFDARGDFFERERIGKP